MNRLHLHGSLKQFCGAQKQQWGVLTQDRRTVAAGSRDRIAGRIQAGCGMLQHSPPANSTFSDGAIVIGPTLPGAEEPGSRQRRSSTTMFFKYTQTGIFTTNTIGVNHDAHQS